MCLVPHEHISDTIVNLGHFPDCDWLVKAWRSHDDPETRGERQPDTFVDAGANIGACSLEMLLRTDARVVAFEPSPVNRDSTRPRQSQVLVIHPTVRVSAGSGVRKIGGRSRNT